MKKEKLGSQAMKSQDRSERSSNLRAESMLKAGCLHLLQVLTGKLGSPALKSKGLGAKEEAI
jgi:hypothetical protein